MQTLNLYHTMKGNDFNYEEAMNEMFNYEENRESQGRKEFSVRKILLLA